MPIGEAHGEVPERLNGRDWKSRNGGNLVRGFESPPLRPLRYSRLRAMGAVVFGLMAEQSTQKVDDAEGERVRRVRLRADGRRSLAVNLEETISLTRKLFELRDAALRAR